jgi:hypothetical protein
MKLILAFLLGFAVAMTSFAQLGGLGSGPGEVKVGDFLWQGKHYRDAIATLEDANTVRIYTIADGEIKVPWAKATFTVQGKLAGARAKLLAEEQRTVAAQPKAGTTFMIVEVQQVLADGALVAPCVERRGAASADARLGLGGYVAPPSYAPGSKVIFLKGLKDVNDQERMRVNVKRDGIWQRDGRTLEQWQLIERIVAK